MDVDEVWRHTHEQRRALAALLADLADDEWAVPSLCRAWTVREVAEHVMRSPAAGRRQTATMLLRHGGRFNAAVAADARRAARRPVAELLADFEAYDGSRRRPPGTSVVDPLLDVLVHSQDIAIPLRRPHPMPVGPAVVAARRAHRLGPLFAGFRVRRRLRIAATDSDLVLGRGALVEGPTSAVLLLLAGRTAASLPSLHGPGVDLLT